MTITRGQIILFLSLVASAALTALIVWLLSKSSAEGTVIREQGPEHHKAKAKIPSNGGRAFMVAMFVVGFPGAVLLSDPRAIIALAAGILAGLIGLADDILKIQKHDSSGLKARYKLPLQIVVGLMAVGAVMYLLEDTTIRLPFLTDAIDIGFWKLPIGLFIFLTIINGVNFTDGLDGLAGSTVGVASIFLGLSILSTLSGSVIVPVVLFGICIGFLPFNWNPAKIFMGDSGALTLGAALAAAAIVTALDITILVIGLVFIIEITSVVMQVVYFRLTGGKRIFRMTPIHHAWELRGYKEPAIVFGATAIGLISGAIGWWSA